MSSRKKHKKRRQGVSEKQRVANHANAQQSTGPRDTSTTRYNAVKHGLRGTFRLMPGESEQEFADLVAAMRADYAAQGPLELLLVQIICESKWLRDRALAEEHRLSKDAPTNESRIKQMLLYSTYRGRAERAMFRAMREIRVAQKARQQSERTPLPDEAFLPEHLLQGSELAAYLAQPGPHLPEKPSEAELERDEMVQKVKADLRYNPHFDPSPYPADVVDQADLELSLQEEDVADAVSGSLSHTAEKPPVAYPLPLGEGRVRETSDLAEDDDNDPHLGSHYLSADKVDALMHKHGVTDWFDIAYLYDPSIPKPEPNVPDRTEPFSFNNREPNDRPDDQKHSA